MSKLVAVVAGVGPGTGAAVARKFASLYPVVLLARNPENYEGVVKDIKAAGGSAVGIPTDIADPKSVKAAFAKIGDEFGGDYGLAAAIFNASGRFVRKPFLELSEDEFSAGLDVSVKGAFLFAQAALPRLVSATPKSQHPPSLIFTGATASVKANAHVASFATGKWALRALSQSLAKEFGPQGVHVSHAIIDGVIDIPRTKDYLKEAGPDAKISADGIADAYWHLHTQPRTTLTWEIDIRPFVEKW
ncbi:Short-chain dehydrogenase/reductase SDR [Neofusicoccum parvum]|uniref:Short-chain dehydrogenase/reductase SDR n=1 Tax=Neofusicoccum parvum TaxID=310453 RepID=A0ACB5RWC4_9PEZI|nr:Short-chain dehydrogenase/reductase SDR [Neofusicoccum parvum]GME51361.1 Short-chain dehydrogenase/reductase SDR [Neofusicoccum parvum]